MNKDNNPAERLLGLLSQASKQKEGNKVREVWAMVLDCDPQDDAEITKRVVELYALCKEVENLITIVPDLNHQLYLSSFTKIPKCMFPLQLNSNWQGQKNVLTGEVLTRLEFSSDALSKHYSEESIKSEDLSEISHLVGSLYDLVESSSIEPTLRLAILEELQKIRASISMYRIKGAKGVKEALQSLLGAIIANKNELNGVKSDDPEILERLGKLIDKLDVFTSRVLKLHRIFKGAVLAALGFGGG